MRETANKQYLCIDLKSFYASVECVDRGLDPMTTDLVVADLSRTNKTICLAVSPSLKAKGVPIQVHTIASMFTPYFSDEPVTNFDEVKRCDQKLFGEFYRQMRAQGVYLAPSAFETGMVSFVHTDEDFSRTLECAAKVRF